MKRFALGVVISLGLAVAAFIVTFNVYWRMVYPGLGDTDGHLDIPAAGATALVIVFVAGSVTSGVWAWRTTHRRAEAS